MLHFNLANSRWNFVDNWGQDNWGQSKIREDRTGTGEILPHPSYLDGKMVL